MCTKAKPITEENHKSRKTQPNTFSSTLLDEIYRSLEEPNFDQKQTFIENPVKERDEDLRNFTNACLVEKWVEKQAKADNDLVFFCSTSSCSDSSGQLSSSSETEFVANSNKYPQVSCFSRKPKPICTRESEKKQENLYLVDEYVQKKNKIVEDDLIMSKTMALKFYANLKKLKQPISPGGRLASFINSIFNNQKAKNVYSSKGCEERSISEASTCSTASSFSRSCLSKYSPKSKEKMKNGIQRTMPFDPVSVIIGEDSKACVKKCIIDEDSQRYRKPPLPLNQLVEMKKNRIIEETPEKVLNGYNRQCKDDFSMLRKIHNIEDEDDQMSDSSSDLFELDHLLLFRNNKFYDELPVYESTNFDTNHANDIGCLIR